MCSLEGLCKYYAHTLVHSPNMSVFPHAQWSLVRHLHQYICHWSAFPCTSANACFERVLVGLCRQRSSIVHMRMDPLFVCCSTVLLSIVVSGFLPCFHCIYHISVTDALRPFCVGPHGWVASHRNKFPKWKLLDVWGTQPLFSDAVVHLCLINIMNSYSIKGLCSPKVHSIREFKKLQWLLQQNRHI